MITLRKLASLPEGTRLRKIARLLESFGRDAAQGLPLPLVYLRGLYSLLADFSWFHFSVPDDEPNAWQLADALQLVREHAGIETADWDMRSGIEEGADRTTLPLAVYLDGIRSPFNVGSIIRTAEFFGFRQVLVGTGSAPNDSPRALRSAMGAESWIEVTGAVEPPSPYFCLETGGTPHTEFVFPESGTCVIGSEELGVRPEILAGAAARVSIPGLGVKGSLNVGVAFGVIAAQWVAALDAGA